MSSFADLVPAPQTPAIDWSAIEDAFDWFEDMGGCPQDPVFHGEGDVKTHTKLVCEALVRDPAWRALDGNARASLFWAALLHDTAKPACTRAGPDGRILAPGHSRRGQIMARRILWAMDVPFRQREEICHLITHHQIPFFLVERERPARKLHEISLQTRCDLLTIHARADANGRVCQDRERLIDNIEMFRLLSEDEDCARGPKQFASAHSRFLYFRKPGRAPDYEAYDDTRSRVTLLSGLPASGKDAWLASQAGDAEVISLDALRKSMGIAPSAPQGRIVVAARERARHALRAGDPLIWNATNLSRTLRASLIDLFADYRARLKIVYLETNQREAERRNAARDRPVPARALKRMLARWEPPDLTECHELDTHLT